MTENIGWSNAWSEITIGLFKQSPYLIVFMMGLWTGRKTKTPANEKDWKELLDQQKIIDKELKKDLILKDQRIDECHSVIHELERKVHDLGLQLKKEAYDASKGGKNQG